MEHPISYSKMSHSQREVDNLLANSPLKGELAISDGEISYIFGIAPDALDTNVKVILTSESMGERFCILFDEGITAYSCADSIAVSAMPTEVKLALLWAKFSQVIPELNETYGVDFEIKNIRITTPDAVQSHSSEEVRFGLKLKIHSVKDKYRSHAIVSLAEAASKNLIPLLKANSFDLESINPSIPLKCKLLLGHTNLKTQELLDIEMSDVILFDEAHIVPNSHSQFNQLLLIENGLSAKVDIEGEKATILSLMSSNMNEQDHESYDDEDDTESLVDVNAISKLSLKVEFHVEGIDLPISDLARLSPGYVFELSADISRPLIATVNGTAIARCELVDIEGRLGARVKEKLQPESTVINEAKMPSDDHVENELEIGDDEDFLGLEESESNG